MRIEDLSTYEIISDEQISDISSRGMILRHKKTGARVALLSNKDDNKVFYIGFRTPPADSTGVAHITEHSVLCGSEKYPVKDPFVELAKGSLNTFLNAMTYPDKTVYPVASCNDADFQNLMDVYLDAVFHPNTYTNDAIFRQEGWHYEFDENGKLFINGVVYNEMKGAFSSPDSVLSRQIMNSLYPETIYGVESGGDPEFIPDLTYEQFLDFHRAYYHPSNSYIYLYGDMDMAEKLDYIDREYLSKYDRREVLSEIGIQTPFQETKRYHINCSLTEGEEARDNTFLSINYSYGDSCDRDLYLAMSIIDSALISAPGSPLQKALLEKGICDEAYSICENGIRQPYFSIVAKGTEISRETEFLDTVREVIEETISKGFDRKALMSAIVKSEFKYREADFGRFPKGLMYGLTALDSWLYDDTNPFVHIAALDTFDRLKKRVETDYFEKLLKSFFVDNKHASIVVMEPKLGFTEEKQAELDERIAKYQASLTDSDIEMIRNDYERLKAFQEQVDTPENLEKIPLLSRDDIKAEAEGYENELTEIDGIKTLLHDYDTNGIAYTTLMFDLKDLPGRYYPYATLLSSVLGVIDTDDHKYADLNSEMGLVSGGWNIGNDIYVDAKDDDRYNYYFSVRSKYLYENAAANMKFLSEMIFRSHLDDTDRLKEIFSQMRSQLQSDLLSSGHSTAVGRAFAGINISDRISDITTGIDFYRFLSELVDNFDVKKEELVDNLRKTAKCIFRPENMMIDITAEGRKGADGLKGIIADLKASLYTEEVEKEHFVPELIQGNEGFMTAGQVQYVCRAGSMKNNCSDIYGYINVMKTIMSYNYLWENVRVKGGAYGCMNRFTMGGGGAFISYRDPNLSRTIKVYEDVPDFLENFDVDERTMTKYVIGTFGMIDTPLTPSAKGTRSLVGYLNSITKEEIQKRRDMARNCSVSDIRNLSEPLRKILSTGKLVVVGSAAKIKEEKELFDRIENLF